MESTRRIGTALLAVLTLLSLAAGAFCGGCDACPLVTAGSMVRSLPGGAPPSVAPPCCHHQRTSPTILKAGCCSRMRTAVPIEASRAVLQSSSSASVALAAAAPADLPAETAAEAPAFDGIPAPPLLHERVGLYTLHAAFLI